MGKGIRKQIMLVDDSGKRVLGKVKTFMSRKDYEEYMLRELKKNNVKMVIEKTL